MAGTRVYIGRIASDTREKDIEKFFKGYGRIRDVLVKNGYSFVVSVNYKLRLLSISVRVNAKKVAETQFNWHWT